MNDDKTIERLQSDIKRLQGIIWEWEEYDGQIKAALGYFRDVAPSVPESVAFLVTLASSEAE